MPIDRNLVFPNVSVRDVNLEEALISWFQKAYATKLYQYGVGVDGYFGGTIYQMNVWEEETDIHFHIDYGSIQELDEAVDSLGSRLSELGYQIVAGDPLKGLFTARYSRPPK